MISETCDNRGCRRLARLARLEPAGAVERDPSTTLRVLCTILPRASGLPATLSGGHVVDFGTHVILSTNNTPAVATAPGAADKTGRPDALAPYVTRIACPASVPIIPMGPGDFLVEAKVSPRLDSGEQLRLRGEAVGTPQSLSIWQLTNVFRGAHRMQVVRITETRVAQSKSTEHKVYFMRPTVNR